MLVARNFSLLCSDIHTSSAGSKHIANSAFQVLDVARLDATANRLDDVDHEQDDEDDVLVFVALLLRPLVYGAAISVQQHDANNVDNGKQ